MIEIITNPCFIFGGGFCLLFCWMMYWHVWAGTCKHPGCGSRRTLKDRESYEDKETGMTTHFVYSRCAKCKNRIELSSRETRTDPLIKPDEPS